MHDITRLEHLLSEYESLPVEQSDFSGAFRHDPVLALRLKAAVEEIAPNSTYSKAINETHNGVDAMAVVAKALLADLRIEQ